MTQPANRSLPSKLLGVELTIWAIWIGAVWFLAVLVAPALFKWLPRPEAGLVAGRLFYMMSWYSVVMAGLLLLANMADQSMARMKWGVAAMVLVLVGSVVELAWMHPTMQTMRAAMAGADMSEVDHLRTQFGHMHAVSSVMYAIKMIGGLAWGISRFAGKGAPKWAPHPS